MLLLLRGIGPTALPAATVGAGGQLSEPGGDQLPAAERHGGGLRALLHEHVDDSAGQAAFLSDCGE